MHDKDVIDDHNITMNRDRRFKVTEERFDQTNVDMQATPVEPVAPEAFDFEPYGDYEASLQQRCRAFWQAESGVLQKSMGFKADVPNFLMPWYGVGTVADAFGIEDCERETDL